MQAVFCTYGCKRDVDEFIKFLETRFLRWPLEKNGVPGAAAATGIVQPIQLWSYAFPKDHRDEVLTTLNWDLFEKDKRYSSMISRTALASLRMGLGLKKIKDYKKDNVLTMPFNLMRNIVIIPVGIKEDSEVNSGDLKHEGI